MRLNQRTVQKLRAGHTVWRCLIWFSGFYPVVSIQEMHLIGVQTQEPVRGRMLRRTAIACGPRGYYLSDIAYADAFTTRRGALKFKREVESGNPAHDERVSQRRRDLREM